jgi:hypothetical protein
MQQKTTKIGRNDPCPCASGLKYKKCCFESKDSELGRFQEIQGQIKQRIKNNGGKEAVFLEPNSHPVKMSEVIIEFADEILRHSHTTAEKRNAITFACVAWNLAQVKAHDEEEYIKRLSSFLETMGTTADQSEKSEYARNLIESLIDKKAKYFSEINRFILDVQMDYVRGELILNIASEISPEEYAEHIDFDVK